MAPKKSDAKAKGKAKAEPKAEVSKKGKANEMADAAAKKKETDKRKASEKTVPVKADVMPVAIVGEKSEESKKRKADEKDKEPPQKVAKIDVGEKGAGVDCGAILKADTVVFEPMNTTLNVLPTLDGRVLMSLSDGGMQYLIAGARANVAVTAGEYMFEVRIIEHLAQADVPISARRGPVPKQLVRVGFSIGGSDLVLGSGIGAVCFDSEGTFIADGEKKSAAANNRFGRDQIVGVVLNVDPQSPNKFTVSLFRDGEQIGEPQPLPESLLGKPLFPHVAYRNVSVSVNFGPRALRKLPSDCRMISTAALSDVLVAPSTVPKDGKYEVLFPVLFPDQGTFDWIDTFIGENPHFVELSDRKILAWAAKSGIVQPATSKSTEGKASNDKPEFCFGIQTLDDFSVRRIINFVAPVVPRNYVVAEVKENLVAADRDQNLKRFNPAKYTRVARVVMGKPDVAFQEKQFEMMLRMKQDKATAEWKAKKAEKERKKAQEKRQQQVLELRKAADERRKKAAQDARQRAEEARKKAEDAKKAAEASAKDGEENEEEDGGETAEAKSNDDEKMDEATEEPAEERTESKDEDAKEAVKADESKDVEMEEEEEPEPVVELTDEEKEVRFQPKSIPDLTASVMSQSFSKFSIPEESEGFDEISFLWDDAVQCKNYVREWVQQQKLTCRLDDLKPGEWFAKKKSEWEKTLKEWQTKQRAYKVSKKDLKKPADSEMEDDLEDEVDLSTVADVFDVGNGEPLFKDFMFEDWILLQLRAELYMLLRGFVKDTDDADRTGFPEKHFAFYYQKYYKKQLLPKPFGVEKQSDLLHMLKDTVQVNETSNMLEVVLDEEAEEAGLLTFAKFVEELRRERARRMDAGDETAKIKFAPNCMAQPATPATSAAGQKLPPLGGVASAAAGASWPGPRPTGGTPQPWAGTAPAAGVRPQAWGWPRPGARPATQPWGAR